MEALRGQPINLALDGGAPLRPFVELRLAFGAVHARRLFGLRLGGDGFAGVGEGARRVRRVAELAMAVQEARRVDAPQAITPVGAGPLEACQISDNGRNER